MTGLRHSYTPPSGSILRFQVELPLGSQGIGIVIPDDEAERWVEEVTRVFEIRSG